MRKTRETETREERFLKEHIYDAGQPMIDIFWDRQDTISNELY